MEQHSGVTWKCMRCLKIFHRNTPGINCHRLKTDFTRFDTYTGARGAEAEERLERFRRTIDSHIIDNRTDTRTGKRANTHLPFEERGPKRRKVPSPSPSPSSSTSSSSSSSSSSEVDFNNDCQDILDREIIQESVRLEREKRKEKEKQEERQREERQKREEEKKEEEERQRKVEKQRGEGRRETEGRGETEGRR